ncbi:MAG: primosomal protein N' [Candidatus Gastranaerophilales bacterium]|nr:primosomal protein N' [Candidatus Gastranaerophilales bacterium]
MGKYALCLVDIKKLGTKTFSYLIPDNLKSKLVIGIPVLVPFGKSRKIKAYVVGFSDYLEAGIKAKYIEDVLDFSPMFNLEYLKLLEWVANYYFSDLPTVLKTALPQKFFEKNVKNYRKPNKKQAIFENDFEKNALHNLSEEQNKVYEEIKHVSSPVSLLHGITGSGKTEVYFKLMEDTIKKGKNVLFLAPEIALVSQLTIRTIKRFGKNSTAIWHSSITEGEKYKVWQRLRNDEIKILFGARSAVFAPIKNLGLIIIDEEHDDSYKQDSPAPRYNAIEVAKKLGALFGAKIIMGSATPDISNYYKAINSNSLFELKQRYNNAELPKVTIVDMRMEKNGLFSRFLIDKINSRIEEGRQTVLLINRRGFSTYTQCLSCGDVLECPKCAVPLIYHADKNTHKCHYCNYEIKGIDECPKCHTDALQNFGAGSQRVEDNAAKIFKNAVIKRLDSDSLSKKNEHVEILNDFQQGKIDILVGTQMIAKGLDNPNVTLVGVINADLSFNLPDFRSTERGFSILTQVAGRSGRGFSRGEVVFQTFNAENEFLLNAKSQDYKTFYKNEIEMREMFDYPPFSCIIRIILQSKNIIRAQRASMEIAMRLKDWISKLSLTERLIVLGPVPCVIEKLKGDFRFNIIIKNKLDERGHSIVLSFLRKVILPSDIKMIVDVDPTDVL